MTNTDESAQTLPTPADEPQAVRLCRHCERRIEQDRDGRWIDPEATGDDVTWRETCDSNDTFTAEHELQDWQPTISADDERVSDAVRGYVTAMLWANACCGVESCTDGREIGDCEHIDGVESCYDLSDFSADDQTSIVADVYAMIAGSAESERDFLAYLESGRDAEHFGHDFALTRNGHGAGFWDRGLGELGDRLTAMAYPYGTSNVDVSEDGVTLS